MLTTARNKCYFKQMHRLLYDQTKFHSFPDRTRKHETKKLYQNIHVNLFVTYYSKIPFPNFTFYQTLGGKVCV